MLRTKGANSVKKKKTESFSKFIVAMIFIVACAAVGAYSGFAAEEYFENNILLSYVVVIGALAAAYLLHIVIHEAGHLVFGRITGYRFKSFRIFNLMWQKGADGKVRFYRYSLAGTAGQCLMTPPDLRNGDMPYVLYNLGGVLFNILLSAAAMGVSCFVGRIGGIVCFVVLIVGVSMALLNGLPLPGITNDGSNLVSLSKSSAARRSFWVQMNGVALLSDGKRVRDFPAEWFVKPNPEQLKNTMESVMAVYVCDRMMDEHQFDKAQAYMDELLESDTAIATVHLHLIRANALFCELIGEGRQEKIEKYMDKDFLKFARSMRTNPSVLRTQYAYYKLYKRDDKQADNCMSLFEKVSATYPYPCEIESERELLEITDNAAKAKASKESADSSDLSQQEISLKKP